MTKGFAPASGDRKVASTIRTQPISLHTISLRELAMHSCMCSHRVLREFIASTFGMRQLQTMFDTLGTHRQKSWVVGSLVIHSYCVRFGSPRQVGKFDKGLRITGRCYPDTRVRFHQ
jgi:hypothetical protein